LIFDDMYGILCVGRAADYIKINLKFVARQSRRALQFILFLKKKEKILCLLKE